MIHKILFVIALISFIAYPQSAVISGKVIDKDTDEPLIGANVIVVGTDYGAATDVKGSFKIKNLRPGNYDIRVSFVGYSPKNITDIILAKGDSIFLKIELETD
jgi:hypothetical protein